MPTRATARELLDDDRSMLSLVAAALVGLILMAGVVRACDDGVGSRAAGEPAPATKGAATDAPAQDPPSSGPPGRPASPAVLPQGGRRIFAGNRFLVAYYGTGGTGALGVLGETAPDVMHRRLLEAARPFRRPGQPVTPVYELIVTVADAHAGRDGDFSHDIDRRTVERYVRAAERNGALLLLDIQPGRSDFTTVARRWTWALREPHVGLALDPEWRMGRREVPGRVIGSVTAAEVNRASAWLSGLTQTHRLPEKLFVLHQFRTSMIEDIRLVRRRAGLAMVQHVDGFGTPRQKLATYHAVERAEQFTMGFKLFYDEDIRRLGARDVGRIRPPVNFVSFQ